MAAANQATVQETLTDLFDTALANPGTYAAVFGHRPGTVEGKSPVLFVVSAGEQRLQPWAGTPKYDNRFRFLLVTCVADADEANDYPRAEVELKINECQQAVAQVVRDNRHNAAWKLLHFADEFSTLENIRLDQLWYWAIYQTVIVEVEDAT